MPYPSFFNVFCHRDHATRVFSLVTKRFFYFPFPWDEVVDVADADHDVAAKLLQSGSFLEHRGYLDQIDEYFQRMEKQDNRNLAVYFCVTSKCSMGCPYCYLNHVARRDSSIGLVDKFLELLKSRLYKAPHIPVLHLVLTGGEPLGRIDLCLRLLTQNVGHREQTMSEGTFRLYKDLAWLWPL